VLHILTPLPRRLLALFNVALGLSVLLASVYPLGLDLLYWLFSPTALRAAFGASGTLVLVVMFQYLLVAALLYLLFQALNMARRFNFRAQGRWLILLGSALALTLAVLELLIVGDLSQWLAGTIAAWLAVIRPVAFLLAMAALLVGFVQLLAAQSMPRRLLRRSRR
jgi:hypothetical protein